MTLKTHNRQNRMHHLKSPGRGFGWKSVTGPLFRAAANGALNGLCQLLKGLAITLVLALGSSTKETKRHCDCPGPASSMAAGHQGNRTPDNDFCNNKKKEIEHHEHHEHYENGCGN